MISMFMWCSLVCIQVFWRTDNSALSFTFKFYIIHHLREETDTTFLQTFRLQKTRLKSEMPGEVTDWSSPLIAHPRWTETAVELNRYRSTAERPWVGTCIIIRAVSQQHCSHWKCLTGLSHWSECCWEETVKYLILKTPVFKHFSGWV